MYDLSIIICSHNPRPSYLARTIEALKAQSLATDRWELLLVDNASKEPLASMCDLSWHPHARHLVESELGLAWARCRGMREAQGDVLVFFDDDNVPAADYLENVIRIRHQYATLGTFGSGRIVGEFEVPPPTHLQKYLRYLALRKVSEPRISREIFSKHARPWGAGLCVSSTVADAYLDAHATAGILISGRRGQALLGGDDDEISIIACKIGFETGIFPELQLTHLIAQHRITEKYLIGIQEGFAITDLLLAYKWQGLKPSHPLLPRGLLRLAKNMLLRNGVDWQMYLAARRGVYKARYLIAKQITNTKGPSG